MKRRLADFYPTLELRTKKKEKKIISVITRNTR